VGERGSCYKKLSDKQEELPLGKVLKFGRKGRDREQSFR